MKPLVILVLAGITFGAGCQAKVTHKQIPYTMVPLDRPHDSDDVRKAVAQNAAADSGTGIRYYRSSPYVLVSSDGNGGINWQLLFLPDQTKKLSADPTVRGANQDLVLNFEDGILTSVTQTDDTTAVPAAFVSTLEKVISAALPAFAAMDAAQRPPRPLKKAAEVPAPTIYKIVVRGNEAKFLSSTGDSPLTVTLAPEQEQEQEQEKSGASDDAEKPGEGKTGDIAGKANGKAQDAQQDGGR